jgi:hypothetical protein
MKKEKSLKERIRRLEGEREKLLKELMEPEDMVAGSVYSTYKKCGKETCRCARGELHGPFMSLSIPKEGKRTLRHIRQGDEDWVKSRAINYRDYQKNLARLRKLDATVLSVLKLLRERHLKTYT